MRVADWMSPDPVTVEPATPLHEARRLLSYYGIRHLPVVRGGVLVGVVSDRDLPGAADLPRDLVLDEPPARPAAVVEDVMSTPAYFVTGDDRIETAARLMLSRRISAAPVVDAERSLVGMITTTDCLLAMLQPAAAR